ncbi:oxidoreductase-like domain-containing protein 1 isoform X2 [Sitophilus oryzae]|uniref:Oxidoreductase-like domain-containing protein 1 isoform X2 n=1 Tax=Sitophilus oryzae TaxID=7048 RepID=A0A6J2Y6M5_SITOR|nr:oxidoreductase-like domain-containing protein 1 isoform X2 [Sitophilus oryzae]
MILSRYRYIFSKTTNSIMSKNSANDTSNDKKKQENSNEKPKEPPEEPTTCCMSGCANCVWLDYAEELCKYYRDGGEKAIKEINERISDPSIKAYLLHEIRMRNKK